jgi:hypothetical protein
MDRHDLRGLNADDVAEGTAGTSTFRIGTA